MGWDKTVPVSGSKITSTPSIFQSNWGAMNDILGEEHYDMTSSLSGRHKPGYVGAMHVSGNAEVAAITSPSTGALAWLYQTGSGVGLLRGKSAWKVIDYAMPASRVTVTHLTTLGYTTSGSNVYPWVSDTETLDSNSEWSTGKAYFEPSASGYFLASVTMALSSTLSGGDTLTMGFSCDTGTAPGADYYTTITIAPSAFSNYSYSTIVSAASGHEIYPYIFYNGHGTVYWSGGDGISFVNFWRVS